jgi:hypothetical protein
MGRIVSVKSIIRIVTMTIRNISPRTNAHEAFFADLPSFNFLRQCSCMPDFADKFFSSEGVFRTNRHRLNTKNLRFLHSPPGTRKVKTHLPPILRI